MVEIFWFCGFNVLVLLKSENVLKLFDGAKLSLNYEGKNYQCSFFVKLLMVSEYGLKVLFLLTTPI